MKPNKEKRLLQVPELQIRAMEEEGKRYFTGYAAVFNSKSRLLAERGKVFYEILENTAFDDVLERGDMDVVLTFNHKRDMIMGRTKSGTLTLGKDEKGLYFRSEVPNTTLGNDTWEMVQRGDYPDCSFVFTVGKNRWEKDPDGTPLHIVERVSGLYDVAIVVDGAYESTVVGAEYSRAIDDLEKEDEDTDESERSIQIQNEIDKMKIELLGIKL